MKKFKYLITSSLLKKIQSKAFVISMIITSVLILAITILPTLFTNIEEEPEIFNVVLIDETDQVNDIRGYLDGILNECKLSGLGTLNFMGCNEIVISEELSGYCLTYAAVHGSDDFIPEAGDPDNGK